MAAPTIRSTYAFDPETVERLERLARRWQLSRSAMLRKLIHEADPPADEQEIADKLAALDAYQAAMSRRSNAEIEQWIRDIRSERRASTAKMLKRFRQARAEPGAADRKP
jgi:hypothetical protein